jgi:hypothetical protein
MQRKDGKYTVFVIGKGDCECATNLEVLTVLPLLRKRTIKEKLSCLKFHTLKMGCITCCSYHKSLNQAGCCEETKANLNFA